MTRILIHLHFIYKCNSNTEYRLTVELVYFRVPQLVTNNDQAYLLRNFNCDVVQLDNS